MAEDKKGMFGWVDGITKSVTDKLGDVVDTIEDKYDLAEEGKLDMNDVLSMVLKSTGSTVDREEYLRKVFEGLYPQEVIDKAIEYSPIAAGISKEDLARIAAGLVEEGTEATKNQKEKMQQAADIFKADKAEDEAGQEKEEEDAKDKAKDIMKKAGAAMKLLKEDVYTREKLKATQKAMYLYGIPAIKINENGTISGDRSRLLMMLGGAAMNEVKDAEDALRAVIHEKRKLENNESLFTALMKLPEIEEIIKEYRKHVISAKAIMTAANSNPLLGKAAMKGSFAKTFESNCKSLIEALSDTDLINPDHKPTKREQELIDAIEKCISEAL